MVTNSSTNTPTAATGQVLQGAGVGTANAFSTATYPSVATGTGKILRADGTNWVATTATFPDTAGTSGNVLKSDGTNWTSSAETGNVSGPGSSTDQAIATWNGTGGTALFNNSTTKIDSTGRQTNSVQPCFLAYKSSASNNVTGDGTVYTIICDTVVFDQNSNYNNSTGVFTAPIAGRYSFTSGVLVLGGTVISSSSSYFKFVTTGRTFLTYPASGVTQYSTSLTVVANMAANDTCTVQISLTDTGGKVDDVYGDANANTYFSGYLIC